MKRKAFGKSEGKYFKELGVTIQQWLVLTPVRSTRLMSNRSNQAEKSDLVTDLKLSSPVSTT